MYNRTSVTEHKRKPVCPRPTKLRLKAEEPRCPPDCLEEERKERYARLKACAPPGFHMVLEKIIRLHVDIDCPPLPLLFFALSFPSIPFLSICPHFPFHAHSVFPFLFSSCPFHVLLSPFLFPSPLFVLFHPFLFSYHLFLFPSVPFLLRRIHLVKGYRASN